MLTPPKFVGLDNYTNLLGDDAVPDGSAEHLLLHGRFGAPRTGPGARPGDDAQPADPRHRLDPDDVLPAAGDVLDGHRDRLALDVQPDRASSITPCP